MKKIPYRSEAGFINDAHGSTGMIVVLSITIASGRSHHSDPKHFEILVLSGAQAGLNWSLVLKKRKVIGAGVRLLRSREGSALFENNPEPSG